MASIYYTLIKSETTPAKPRDGWVWVKQSTNMAFLACGGQWLSLAGGYITTQEENVVEYLQHYAQSATPTARIGQKYTDTDTNTSYIYLGSWVSYAAG